MVALEIIKPMLRLQKHRRRIISVEKVATTTRNSLRFHFVRRDSRWAQDHQINGSFDVAQSRSEIALHLLIASFGFWLPAEGTQKSIYSNALRARRSQWSIRNCKSTACSQYKKSKINFETKILIYSNRFALNLFNIAISNYFFSSFCCFGSDFNFCFEQFLCFFASFSPHTNKGFTRRELHEKRLKQSDLAQNFSST